MGINRHGIKHTVKSIKHARKCCTHASFQLSLKLAIPHIVFSPHHSWISGFIRTATMGYRSVVDHQQFAGIQRYDQLIDLERRIRWVVKTDWYPSEPQITGKWMFIPPNIARLILIHPHIYVILCHIPSNWQWMDHVGWNSCWIHDVIIVIYDSSMIGMFHPRCIHDDPTTS